MSDVYSGKWGADFASILKGLQPSEKVGVTIGEIVGLSPLVVELIDGEIMINSDVHDIFISSHLSGTYSRDTDIEGGIVFNDSDTGTTTVDGDPSHTHGVESLNVDTQFNISGNITLTDGIKVGDRVMVVPDNVERTFFIVSKLIKVGGD